MPAAITGQKAAISLVTSALSIVTTMIKPPSYTVDDIEIPNLALDPGACMPMDPGDLAKPGVIEVEFEDDESLNITGALRVKQDVIITFRPPAGLTNGATQTWASAYLKMYDPAALATGQRRIGKLQIQVRGFPTKVAAS
jgi:hypothetical protein